MCEFSVKEQKQKFSRATYHYSSEGGHKRAFAQTEKRKNIAKIVNPFVKFLSPVRKEDIFPSHGVFDLLGVIQ